MTALSTAVRRASPLRSYLPMARHLKLKVLDIPAESGPSLLVISFYLLLMTYGHSPVEGRGKFSYRLDLKFSHLHSHFAVHYHWPYDSGSFLM